MSKSIIKIIDETYEEIKKEDEKELCEEFAKKYDLTYHGLYPDGDLQFDSDGRVDTWLEVYDDGQWENVPYQLYQKTMRIYTGIGKCSDRIVSYGKSFISLINTKIKSWDDIHQGRLMYEKGHCFEMENVPFKMYQDIIDLVRKVRELYE